MLELDSVSKTYKVGTFGGKDLHAVTNVSFSVDAGEVISLIGESGSGKSTIGKLILRLIPLSSGSIYFDGVDISTLKGEELKNYYRKVQGVFQDPFSSYNPIFKADRLFRIIKEEFYPQINAKEWEDKVARTLKDVGLNPGDVLNKFPHQLSGGQLQRFLIARALLLDLKFLVADEIISMLDASRRIDVLNLLADLKTLGLSILFITHDLSLGYYVSERAIILYGGGIAEMGAIDKIYSNPVHPYTKLLMASVPRLDKEWEAVNVDLRGKQAGYTGGCIYHRRCADATDKCLQEPPMTEIEKDHYIACWKEIG